jgi:tetratricopeptide (TPR) repeat protein
LEVNTTVLNFCMHGNSISTSLVNVIDAHLKANFALSGQRFPQAIAVFEKMKNEAGGDDSTTKAADEGKKKCLKIWGKKLQKDGDSQGALDKFKEALGIDPNDTTIENLKQTIIQDNHDVDDNMPGLEAPSGGAISAQELGLDAQLVGEN